LLARRCPGINGLPTDIGLFTAAPVTLGAAVLADPGVSILLRALVGAATTARYRAFAFHDPR
jgi:hypothetical protein